MEAPQVVESSFYEANDPGEDGMFCSCRDETMVVGVVDGHGGRLAAAYAEQHLPELVMGSVKSSDDQTLVVRALHVSLKVPTKPPLVHTLHTFSASIQAMR
jgi:hypothetical protein